MNEVAFEDVVNEYLRRMETEGRIPPQDRIHQEMQRALARIMK